MTLHLLLSNATLSGAITNGHSIERERDREWTQKPQDEYKLYTKTQDRKLKGWTTLTLPKTALNPGTHEG